MLGAALRVGVERGGQVVDFALHHGQARCGGGHHAPVELRDKTQRGLERIGLKHPPLALHHQPAPYPLAHLAPGLAQRVGAVDLKIHLIGMHRQHVRQRLHGGIKRHAIALVFKQRVQAAQYQRRPPRCQQQPGRVLLAGGYVFVGALLVEGGHGEGECGAVALTVTGPSTALPPPALPVHTCAALDRPHTVHPVSDLQWRCACWASV